MEEENSEQTQRFTYKKMMPLEANAGQTLFKIGERGEYFYVILDGEVEVRVPSPIELSGEQA